MGGSGRAEIQTPSCLRSALIPFSTATRVCLIFSLTAQSSEGNRRDFLVNLEKVARVLVTHCEGWLHHGNGHLSPQESELRVP